MNITPITSTSFTPRPATLFGQGGRYASFEFEPTVKKGHVSQLMETLFTGGKTSSKTLDFKA